MARRYMNTRGFEDLDRRLSELSKGVATKAGNKAVRRGAVVAAKEMRGDAPVDTGTLKRNIRARKGRSKAAQTITYVVSAGKAFYAKFLEYGTRKMPAQPFAAESFARVSKDAFAEIKAELSAALDRIARGGKP